MLRFRVFKNGVPPAELDLTTATSSARTACRFAGVFLCQRRNHLPQSAPRPGGADPDVGDKNFGNVMLETNAPPGTRRPYILNLELARGRVMRLMQKREEWGIFDLADVAVVNENQWRPATCSWRGSPPRWTRRKPASLPTAAWKCAARVGAGGAGACGFAPAAPDHYAELPARGLRHARGAYPGAGKLPPGPGAQRGFRAHAHVVEGHRTPGTAFQLASDRRVDGILAAGAHAGGGRPAGAFRRSGDPRVAVHLGARLRDGPRFCCTNTSSAWSRAMRRRWRCGTCSPGCTSTRSFPSRSIN